MLRRVLEGLGLLLLVAVLFGRVDAGFMLGGALAADAPMAQAGNGGETATGVDESGMDIGGGFGGDM